MKTDPTPRLVYWKASPQAMHAMLAFEKAVSGLGLEQSLIELIKLRVSQINGCAYCVDMHFRDAKKKGETDERLYLLSVWPEAHVYTDRERAAFRWAEALTRLAGGHVSDEDFAEVSAHFSEAEVVNLTLAIVTINGWNRFGVGFRMPHGLPPGA